MTFGLNTIWDILVNCIFYFQHELLFYLFAFNALPIFNELHALQHAFVYWIIINVQHQGAMHF